MNIAIDISQSVYTGSGVASYTTNLVRALLLFDKHNHYTLFGSALRRQAELGTFIKDLPNCTSFTSKLYTLPPTLLHFMWNRFHVLSIDRFVGNVDVVHTSDWTEPPSRARKVTTIHDLVVFRYPQSLPRRIRETQLSRLVWVKKETDMVIVDSENTKTDVTHYLGIPESKIKVVYLGVEQRYYPQSLSTIRDMRKKYQLLGKYILCVGTLEPRKNLERIISAFTQLKEQEVTLVIAGNPGWGIPIKENQRVRQLGFVSSADLPALYSGATGFVYPSLYEGFGLPVLEAMACGTPVLTSRRGSLAEIVGKTAIIVNPEDSDDITLGIKKLLSLSGTSRRSMVEAGIKHASSFSWEKTARQTLAVYESLQ